MEIIREPNLTGRKIRKRTVVLLTKKWSDWAAGQTIELEAKKAERVIAKGYGEVFKPSKRPKVETETAPPPAENADAPPELKESQKETADKPPKKKE